MELSQPKNATELKASSELLAHTAARVLIEKKALDVRLYCVGQNSSVTDYFLNVTGRSVTQVASLVDYLIDELEKRGVSPLRVEGKRGTTWFLVDFGDLIVNIFDRPSREFYNFDHLLPEDSAVSVEEDIRAVDEKLSLMKTTEEKTI